MSKRETAEERAEHEIEYEVSAQEVAKINKSKSKTLPVLIFWLVYLVAAGVIKFIFREVVYDFQYVVWAAGGATFAYMGIEYFDSFIKNKQLPMNHGKVDNIERYLALVMTWCVISVFFTVIYFITSASDVPWLDAVAISGMLSIEYVSGNKINKIGTTMDEGSLDFNHGSKPEDKVEHRPNHRPEHGRDHDRH